MDETLLRKNIVSTVKTVKAFGVPIVHSTVNVACGQQQPAVPELAALLEDSRPPLDRTTVNSWEDTEFVQAVHATGARKLVFCALWTEVCMAFTALDALREGYEVYPVVDAIGGTSPEAHRAALERGPPRTRPHSSGRAGEPRDPRTWRAHARGSRRQPIRTGSV